MRTSLLIISCNDAVRLPFAIASARELVDEVVVVVQDSTDNTVYVARACADVVLFDRCHGTCEPSRPIGMSGCTGDWIVVLDSDEVLTPYARFRLRMLPAFAEQYDMIRLRRLTLVEGTILEDRPHNRMFRRSHVEVRATLHTEFEPLPGARVITLDKQVCIAHNKTRAEQDDDTRRYDEIGAGKWPR